VAKDKEEEMQALVQNKTWELVPKSKDTKLISCKWVYRLKVQSNGSIERYKVH